MCKYRFGVTLILVTLFVAGCQKPSGASEHTIRQLEANATLLEAEVATFEQENTKLPVIRDELTSVGTTIEKKTLEAYTKSEAEIARIILESENHSNHLIIEDINIDQTSTDGSPCYYVEATAGYRPSSPSGLYEDLSALSSYLADILEDQAYATVNTLKLNYRDDTHGQTIWYYYERIGEDLVLTDSHA